MAKQLSAPLTCLTAGGLGIVYAALQVRVGLHRLKSGILLGTAAAGMSEDEQLVAKSRAGGNMQEYLPTGLLLMLLLETSSPLPARLVAVYGAALAASRLAAAYGLSSSALPSPARKYGFLSTVGCLVLGGAYLAVQGVRGLARK